MLTSLPQGAACGLALASELFGVKFPMRSRTTAETCARDDLLRAVHAALVRPAGVFADRWDERRTHRTALDRWSGRLRYDVYRPTPLEPAWSEGPESLTFLYGRCA
jgi:hypothetical protein